MNKLVGNTNLDSQYFKLKISIQINLLPKRCSEIVEKSDIELSDCESNNQIF